MNNEINVADLNEAFAELYAADELWITRHRLLLMARDSVIAFLTVQ